MIKTNGFLYLLYLKFPKFCSLHQLCESNLTSGRSATEVSGNGAARAKDGDQTLNRGPGTHAGASKSSQAVEGGRDGEVPGLQVTASPAFDAGIMPSGDAGGRVETFAGQGRSLLNPEPKEEDRGKAVGEIQAEQAADETDEAAKVGHGRSNEEGQDPVDRSDAVPHDLALLRVDRREVEELLEDLQVDGLHANVEIQD